MRNTVESLEAMSDTASDSVEMPAAATETAEVVAVPAAAPALAAAAPIETPASSGIGVLLVNLGTPDAPMPRRCGAI